MSEKEAARLLKLHVVTQKEMGRQREELPSVTVVKIENKREKTCIFHCCETKMSSTYYV